MDLSSSMSARDSMMMSLANPNSNSSGAGGGAVACPVCTLYLREGISLQKHLDTHPKEQVIEALIRASSTGVGLPTLFGQASPSGFQQIQAQPQVQTQPQTQASLQPQPQHPLQAHSQIPPLPPSNASAVPTTASASHVPQVPTQSPFPIGPIFECPPINAMMPPQFASFSYQQFVNNGKFS